jgi:hypothetical protein
MDRPEPTDELPPICARCAVELQPGDGSFYVVRIEALADPTPPSFSAEDLDRDVRQDLDDLFWQVLGLSEQEALYQVYRRLTIFLCGPCYEKWIEDPAGCE